MKKIIKKFTSILCVVSAVVFSAIGYYSYKLPDNIMINQNEKEIKIEEFKYLTATAENPVSSVNKITNNHYKAKFSLFGLLPVEAVDVHLVEESNVMVLGIPFGMKIYTDGVMIVDFTDVETTERVCNPCKEAGIQAGDIIIAINGEMVYENRAVISAIKESGKRPIDFLIKRNNKERHYTITPTQDKNGEYKIGIWIRDSSAGIGTLTFCDENGVAAGLGHGICDVDTGELLDVLSGEFVEAQIVGVQKGTDGIPGELKGVLRSRVLGEIITNDITGIYGKVNSINNSKQYKIAQKQEIKSGKAKVLSTVDGNGPLLYDCEIKKINFNDKSKTQNFIVEITDATLISKTGGIVQGMSGSPIIQDGKLIGAVTHVFVDDPTKGYGIFAENMLETAQSVAEDKKLKDAS